MSFNVTAGYYHGEHFIVENEQEAIQRYFYEDEITSLKLRKDNPELYQKVDAAVDFIHQRMIEQTGQKDLPKPVVILSDDHNDYSQGHYDRKKNLNTSSNVIVMNTEKLLTEEYFYGSLSHEMAHYHKNHGKTLEKKDEVLLVYNASDDDCIECLAQARHYQELVEPVKGLISDFEGISHFLPIPEQQDLPFDPFRKAGETALVLDYMVTYLDNKGLIPNHEACTDAFYAWIDIYNLGLDRFNIKEQEINYTLEDRQFIADQTEILLDRGQSCFEEHPQAFDHAVQTQYGISVADAKRAVALENNKPGSTGYSQSSVAFLRQLASNENPIHKIQNISRATQERIQKGMDKVGDLKQLRYLSEEDEADQIAFNTLKGTAYEQGLYNLILNADSSEKVRACKAKINKGIEPNFGTVLDIHHSDCWRAWRLKQYSQYSLVNR
jgi:hypothetical protein